MATPLKEWVSELFHTKKKKLKEENIKTKLKKWRMKEEKGETIKKPEELSLNTISQPPRT